MLVPSWYFARIFQYSYFLFHILSSTTYSLIGKRKENTCLSICLGCVSNESNLLIQQFSMEVKVKR